MLHGNMKHFFSLLFLLLCAWSVPAAAQEAQSTEAYPITASIIAIELNGDVNLDTAMDPESWIITSDTDEQYVAGVHPDAVERFASTLNADDRDSNGQKPDDVVQRHQLYLYMSDLLQLDQLYSIVGEGMEYRAFVYPNNGGGTDGDFVADTEDTLMFAMMFGDESARSRVLKLNQVGYSATATERYVYAGAWLGSGGALPLTQSSFSVHDVETQEEVLTGTTSEPAFDEDSGEQVMHMDISALPAGEYYVEVPELGRSENFTVGANSFLSLYTTARGLFHQRAGTTLTQNYTQWTHADCHATVYEVNDDSPYALEDWGKFFSDDLEDAAIRDANTEVRTIRGGWYDAGDYDRRPYHIDIVDELTIAQEVFAQELANIDLDIPESNNSIPDLLDEALYGLGVWEQLQQEDGGVRSGVESVAHPPAGTCEDDTMPYFTYSANQLNSYRYAAAAANLGRVLVEQYDQEERGQQLIDSAERAFAWAEERTQWDSDTPAYGVTYGNSPNPSTLTEEQLENFEAKNRANIARVRLAASGNIFAATGTDEYQDVYRDLAADEDLRLLSGTYHETVYSLWGMAVSTQPNTDTALQDETRQTIEQKTVDPINYLSDGHQYKHSLKYGYAIGNGNATIASQYTLPMIMAYHLTDDVDEQQAYMNAISLNVDYQYGANPNGLSWVTGLGIHNPSYPLQLNSMYDTLEAPVPGLPIYGPFERTFSTTSGTCEPANYWQCLVYNSFYPAQSSVPGMYQYTPWAGMAPMNEFTVWQGSGMATAAAAFLFATSGEEEIVFHEDDGSQEEDPEETPNDNSDPEDSPTENDDPIEDSPVQNENDAADGEEENNPDTSDPQSDESTSSTTEESSEAVDTGNPEIDAIVATERGFRIVFSDGTESAIRAFTGAGKRVATTKWLKKSGLVLVVQPNSKRIKLFTEEGVQIASKRLSKKSYGRHAIHIDTIRGKKHIVITALNKKRKRSQLTVLRFKPQKKSFGKKRSVRIRGTVRVHKTVVKKRRIVLRKKAKTVSIRVGAQYQLYKK